MGILRAFANLLESRKRQRSCWYRLDELLLVALCGVVSGANDWVGVVLWAELKLEWLRQFLPFENGVASHDTFGRVFALLDAQQFEACFMAWMHKLCPTLAEHHIPIDGKSLRGSYNGDADMAHLVSAFDSHSGLVLGQTKPASKSNEITAIPELLDALDIQRAIMSIDAAGCQRAIVQKVVQKNADYVIAVKDNQPKLAQAIEQLFIAVQQGEDSAPQVQQHTEIDKGHGRVEARHRTVIDNSSSSRQASASEFNELIRGHWRTENGLYWIMDVVSREDDSRLCTRHGAQNFAALRRTGLNLIKRLKTSQQSFKAAHQTVAWSIDVLEADFGPHLHR